MTSNKLINSELNSKIKLFLFKVTLSDKMFDVAIKFLKQKNCSKMNDCDMTPHELLLFLQFEIGKIIYHKELVPISCQMMHEKDSHRFQSESAKKRFLWCVRGIIGEITKFGLVAYNQILVKEGFISFVKDIAESNDVFQLKNPAIWKALTGILDAPGLMNVDQLF